MAKKITMDYTQIVTQSQLKEKFNEFDNIDLDDEDAVEKYLTELASYKGSLIINFDENIDYKKWAYKLCEQIENKIQDKDEQHYIKRRISKDKYEWLKRNSISFEVMLENIIYDDYGLFDVTVIFDEEDGKRYISVLWTDRNEHIRYTWDSLPDSWD